MAGLRSPHIAGGSVDPLFFCIAIWVSLHLYCFTCFTIQFSHKLPSNIQDSMCTFLMSFTHLPHLCLVLQYIQPHEHAKLSQVELLVVDEAAAIPLPVVKSLLGPYLVFLSSTVNG